MWSISYPLEAISKPYGLLIYADGTPNYGGEHPIYIYDASPGNDDVWLLPFNEIVIFTHRSS